MRFAAILPRRIETATWTRTTIVSSRIFSLPTMSNSAKTYVDNAVQTTFSPPSSPNLIAVDSLAVVIQSRPRSSDDSRLQEPSSSPQTVETVYDASPTSPTSSTPQFFSTSRRVIKPQQLPSHFPSQMSQVGTSRTASFPETMSLFSAKSQLSQRIVSMPEDIKTLVRTKEYTIYSSDYNDISSSTVETFVSGDGNRFHLETGSHLNQIPHTPSPPSSPDSVVIIDNKYQLSETFLRNHDRIREFKPKENEGILASFFWVNFAYHFQGWITWSSSPPRPIPALHGPLSLPYARCPSYVATCHFRKKSTDITLLQRR